jgi:hypothetical protein
MLSEAKDLRLEIRPVAVAADTYFFFFGGFLRRLSGS